ncbi:MAG: hypothetical protein AAGA90_10265 [Actinomycetota bacterium]
MSLTLLLPALAVVLALSALTLSLRAVEHELAALRVSLRRTSATAVAADDLARTTASVRQRAAVQAADAGNRVTRRPRWWSQQGPDPR